MHKKWLNKGWLWLGKNWKHIVPMILSLAVIYQGYSIYQLNKTVTERDAEIHKGKQVLLLYNTREFLIQYITNFLKYLAFEYNKVLTTRFNSISSEDPADPTIAILEKPILSRRYYVDTLSLLKFSECRALIGMPLPDEQDQIDTYFRANPSLSDLEKGIFDSKRTLHYLELKRLIDIFNEDFNKYAVINKHNEKVFIIAHSKDQKKHATDEKIDWRPHFIRRKNALVQSIRTIKEKGDLLLKSFPDLNIEALKFVVDTEALARFKKHGEVDSRGKPVDDYINPIKEATISLDNHYYKFDYYIYFTKSIENMFLDMLERQKAAQIKE